MPDSGTFCGLHHVPRNRGKDTFTPFRFNQSLELFPDQGWLPIAINSSGDMVTNSQIYHDDWGWVDVRDLVVGTQADLKLFRNYMNDRAGQTEFAQITGLTLSAASLFILTPEPAPTP